MKRCDWATISPILREYHDKEWGVPVHDDRRLFEFLVLEGAQAGLSWTTVLQKRENYRKAFDGFDPAQVSQYKDADVEKLLANSGIIRNRLKIIAAVRNAQLFLEIRRKYGSFDEYVWRFVGGSPIKHRFQSLAEIPSKTKESDALSREFRRLGFQFTGSTICYAFMQAVGMVNDHLADCFRYRELQLINRKKA
ncbi:MAG: DNA-3-methyladenine glycosylase I [Thaumarchaeota archaeon]|nr:DNA-3-methyladenine glycosylase I [Nitrososphaerota archaeon]